MFNLGLHHTGFVFRPQAVSFLLLSILPSFSSSSLFSVSFGAFRAHSHYIKRNTVADSPRPTRADCSHRSAHDLELYALCS